MSTGPVEAPPIAPPILEPGPEAEIDYDALVTEDHKPVDSIFLEKLYRLLTHPLYASWPGPGEGRPFLVLVNVGWFYQRKTPAVVPDCLLSLDATCPEDLHVKQGHSYYQWDVGKPPNVIIEFVSDRRGGEQSYKKDLYAGQGVAYYAVFDPKHLLSADTLQTYELAGGVYRLAGPGPWPKVGLGLRLWPGTFEGHQDTWLRWCDANGEIIPTGEERASQADERASKAEERARQADERASKAEDRARQVDERLRMLEAEVRRLKGEPPT
jgi:Uma2 family endonuclease